MADGSDRLDGVPAPTHRLTGAGRRLRARGFDSALPIVGIWVAASLVLSQITGRVTDWYVMTDELVYERLAISIAKTGSPLPSVHGVLVRSLDQLYPWLISPLFAHGSVLADLHRAHLLGAWLMSSACIPAFLLARRVTGKRWPAYFVGLLSICVPWMLYASFLLTEAVAYPAFVWAMLAIQAATSSPSRRNDLLALLALGLAFLARTELAVLAVVLPLTVAAYHLALTTGSSRARRVPAAVRAAVRAHPVLAVVYAVLALAVAVFAAAGGKLADLTVYGQEIHASLIPPGTAGAFLGHLSQLAFGVAILPFVVGMAWLLANAVRRAETAERQAFASLGAIVVPVLTLEVAKYDLGLGPVIYDRYLFYLVPIVLLGFLCALLDPRAPRWSLLLPAALVCAGFAVHFQSAGTWTDVGGRVDADSPVSIFYKPIVGAAHSIGAAQATLVAATILLTGAFALVCALARGRARVTVVFALLVALLLPLETGWVFWRLFRVDDYAFRPLTGTQTQVPPLDWLDREVGQNAKVTIIPYQVSTAFLVSLNYWRDIEFWNKSVERDAEFPSTDAYAFTGIWFPKTQLSVDPATGAVTPTLSPYVVQAVDESRFRIAGPVRMQTPQALLIAATRPWHVTWLSVGAYDDGWMKPGVPVRLRIYSTPGQRRAETRFLNLQFWAPADVSGRRFRVVSNLVRYHGTVTAPVTTFVNGLRVCVPARGYTDVTISAQGRSLIPGDLSSLPASVEPRLGSVHIADTSISDDVGALCDPGKG